MKTFLFLLHKENIWAFCRPSEDLQSLKYQGRSEMAYQNEFGVLEFVQYMLDNYGNGTASSISFICCDPLVRTLAVAAGAIMLKQGQDLPPSALYTLPYLLPQFCRKMEIATSGKACLSFDKQAWLIDGTTVAACSVDGRVPYQLKENDVARLFFTSEPLQSVQVEENEQTEPRVLGELARYVDRSAVKPKSATRRGM